MNVSYDPEANAMSIRLREYNDSYERTEEMMDGVLLDYNHQGQVLSVEILYVANYAKAAADPALIGVDVEALVSRLESIGNDNAALPVVAELVRRALPRPAAQPKILPYLAAKHAQPRSAASRSKTDRIVFQREDNMWANKRSDASRATSVHKTQQEAMDAARANLGNRGGGELTVKGRDGKILKKDTVYPGNDPNPPTGKKKSRE